MTTINSLGIFNNFMPSSPATGVSFRSADFGFPLQTNPILREDRYSSEFTNVDFENPKHIEQLAKSNPRIMELWKEIQVLTNEPRAKLKVNIKGLQSLKREHLLDSRMTIAKMYSYLPQELKENVSTKNIQEAAFLHDYGKVLIPEKILNKDGPLTSEEKKVMDMHSELGYELLKMQGVNENVLKLIKYHHQLPDGSGYPDVGTDFEWSTEAQMMKASDMYSALTEPRSYKPAYSKEQALEIIKKDVDKGIISQDVFNALSQAVNQ